MFCNLCRALLQRIKNYPENGSGHHHESYESFTDALAGGCTICKRCWRQWRDCDSEEAKAAFRVKFSYKWEKDSDPPPDFKSGLPEKTVSITFERVEDTKLPWQNVFEPVWLNLVPVQADRGAIFGFYTRRQETDSSLRDA